MKAKEVLETLEISRQTLKRYREKGILKATLLPNKHYDFDEKSVYDFKNKLSKKINVIYATNDEKLDELKEYAKKEKINIDKKFIDSSKSQKLNEKTELMKLLNFILESKIKTVIIHDENCINDFDWFKLLCNKFNTKIILVK